MIDCANCGRANDERFSQCFECGTELPSTAEDRARKEKWRVDEQQRQVARIAAEIRWRVATERERQAVRAGRLSLPMQFGLRLLLGGFLAYAYAIGTTVYTWHFKKTARPARGSVVETHKIVNRNGHETRYVTFRFQDAAGIEHAVKVKLCSSASHYDSGDTVPVLYDPDDPRHASIDIFGEAWGDPIEKAFWGTMYLPLALIFLFWRKLVTVVASTR